MQLQCGVSQGKSQVIKTHERTTQGSGKTESAAGNRAVINVIQAFFWEYRPSGKENRRWAWPIPLTLVFPSISYYETHFGINPLITDMGRKAIFGGTFDPIHWGHLLIAETALSQIALEQVVWVPARRPPHKQVLPYEHRQAIVKCAIADNPAFILDAPPITNAEPDYAINTLAYFRQADPKQDWYWIIGLDAFQTLPRWYARAQLIPACNWLVAPRPFANATQTNVLPEQQKTHKAIDSQMSQLCQQVARQLASQNISIRWQLLQMPPVGISSSLIRQYCRQHCSIRYLVPETVRAYIAIHKLYSD